MGLTRRGVLASLLSVPLVFLIPVQAYAKRGSGAGRSFSNSAAASRKSNARAARLISRSKDLGGHFVKRHVAKPPSYLRARATAPHLNTAFKTAVRPTKPPSKAARKRVAKLVKGRYGKAKRKEYSTFNNEQIAQAVFSRALARNDARIRAWMKSGKKRFVVQTKVPGTSGIVYLPGSDRMVQPKKAVFVLQRYGRSFRLHTGYLSSRGGPKQ